MFLPVMPLWMCCQKAGVQVNIAKLTKSIQSNNVENLVRLLPFAVGSSDGVVALQVDPVSNAGNGEIVPGSSSGGMVRPGRQMAQEARIVRLDDFGTDPIFFLKIDTEGYEQHVLRGAANLLRNSTARPVHIMMEFSPGLQVRRAYT